MATRDINGYRNRVHFWQQLLGQLSRYDLLLAAIPLVMAGALAVYLFAPIPFHLAVAASGVLGAVVMVDALYFNPPTSELESTRPNASTHSPVADSEQIRGQSPGGD